MKPGAVTGALTPEAALAVRESQKEVVVQLDPTRLLDSLGLETPPIGLYDAPDPTPFEPCVRPAPGARGRARSCSTGCCALRSAWPWGWG